MKYIFDVPSTKVRYDVKYIFDVPSTKVLCVTMYFIFLAKIFDIIYNL